MEPRLLILNYIFLSCYVILEIYCGVYRDLFIFLGFTLVIIIIALITKGLIHINFNSVVIIHNHFPLILLDYHNAAMKSLKVYKALSKF